MNRFVKFLSLFCLLILLTGCPQEPQQQQQDDVIIGDSDIIDFSDIPIEEEPVITFEEPEPEPTEPAEVPAPLRPAQVQIQPTAVRIPGTLFGNQSRRTLVIANRGEELLELKEIRLIPGIPEFVLSGTCLEEEALPPTDTCTVSVTFKPTQDLDQTLEAELGVFSNAPESPAFVQISAQSLQTPPPVVAQPPPQQPLQQIVDSPSFEILNALEISRQRKSGTALVAQDPDVLNPRIKKDVDQDYAAIGFPPTVTSLPIDRSMLITADRYIPAVLENTINSQIPGGRIVGIVERHVYGADNRYVLVPSGSRIIGSYGALGAGTTRLQVTWNRIIRPDGIGIAISAPGADPMGRLGLIGDVDTRFWDRYGGPLLVSLIQATSTYLTAPENVTTITDADGNASTISVNDPEGEAVQDVGEGLGRVTEDLVRSNLNIQPVITVPGGTRFYVLPTEDIYFARPTLITSAQLEIERQAALRQAGGGQAALPPAGVSQQPGQRSSVTSGNADLDAQPSPGSQFVIEGQEPLTDDERAAQAGLPPPNVNRF